MGKGMIAALFLAALVSKAHASENCQHDAEVFRCVKYINNYDGDTLTVEIPGVHPLLGKKISVRVLGIDTPEVKTKNTCEKDKARMARNLVEKLLKRSQKLELHNIQRDKYFRILADVKVDGRSLSQVLLKNHLAVAYDGGTKARTNWCAVNATADIVP